MDQVLLQYMDYFQARNQRGFVTKETRKILIFLLVSLVTNKRAANSPLENESAPSKKRNVTVETVKKWILENDKEIATST